MSKKQRVFALVSSMLLFASALGLSQWRVQAGRYGGRAIDHSSPLNAGVYSSTRSSTGASAFLVITVNTLADENNVGASCSMREAIIAANTNAAFGGCAAGAAGLDTIEFALGAGTPSIAVTGSALPTITEPVIINGNTGGATRVELNGAAAGMGVTGLNITAGSSTVRALVINRFTSDGILLASAGSNSVVGCFIGTDAAGTADLGNTGEGVHISSTSSNTVGGTTVANRNVISGNGGDGVEIDNEAGGVPSSNVVQGNYIGVDVTGTVIVANGSNGVAVLAGADNTLGGTTGVTAGGPCTGACNVLSGNSFDGISIAFSSVRTQVMGNFIGTDVSGTLDRGNRFEGININGPSKDNTIGGSTTAARNIISGNGSDGVEIQGTTATGNQVLGNFIGTQVNGLIGLANDDDGVFVSGAPTNTIGGTIAGAGNVISANGSDGVEIKFAGATGNMVLGNFIGPDVNGTGDLGNVGEGVHLTGVSGNTVGGTTAASRNVISGNGGDGVEIDDEGGEPPSSNIVQGNYIGVNSSGTGILANGSNGVAVLAGSDNIIGGTTGITLGGPCTGACNVLSGNAFDGISIAFSSTRTQVIGNFIGTDVSGTLDLGNTFEGVNINGPSSDNIIGGTTGAARNVLSGNGSDGIEIQGSTATGNQVLGNFIGTQADGLTALANSDAGVFISGAANNTIGGTSLGAGNVISGNTDQGISVSFAGSLGNRFLGNSIFLNTALGIDLTPLGVTVNDPGDTDTGPNNLQNFPDLTCATSGGGSTTIRGTLNSLADTTFRIEFFSNAACDPSGNGEGQAFIGFTNVTTNGSGDVTFTATVAATVAAGQFITSTATRLDGSSNPVETSEFSNCVSPLTPTVAISDVSQQEGNAGITNFDFTVTLNGAMGSCVPIIINFATGNGTATGGVDFVPSASFIVFNPPILSNSVMQTITIPVIGEKVNELNETFFVNIGPVSATATDAQGMGTIINDDFVIFEIIDTFGCTGPGDALTVSGEVGNLTAAPVTITFTASLPPGLLALPGSCTTSIPGAICSVLNAATVSFTGTVPANATGTFSYLAQVGDLVTTGTILCINSVASFGGSPPVTVQECTTVTCPPVGPGDIFPATSEGNGQKAGSVLLNSVYTSNSSMPALQNTLISMTNVHLSLSTFVHLFFIDGATCSLADSYTCLTPSQTLSFLTSDMDPGTTGYFVAVAVNSIGCPVNFNYLIGDAYVKFASGHSGNLGAEAISALAGGLPACDANSQTAVLRFDDVSYNALARVLAVDGIPSRATGNDTLLVINRLGGNFLQGASPIGSIFGILYNDEEQSHSFTFERTSCQVVSSLSNSLPRTAPPFESVITGGSTGWMKLWGIADIGIFGAKFNFNPNVASSAEAYGSGRNLHKLRLTTAASITIPIFTPHC